MPILAFMFSANNKRNQPRPEVQDQPFHNINQDKENLGTRLSSQKFPAAALTLFLLLFVVLHLWLCE